jgi:UDP-glucose 4-epimerase
VQQSNRTGEVPADTTFTFQEHADHYSGKRVVVTGGLGFIGSSIAKALAAIGAEVTVVDALIPEYGGNLRNLEGVGTGKVRVNMSDVRNRYTMPYFIRNAEVLFNLAGQTSHMDSMTDPETDLDINARSQLSILETCREHNPEIRIVFASTRQIYGRPLYLPADEHHPLKPVDVNGINKLAGEGYHIVYNDVYGIRSTVLRLTNTIGPRMRVKDARQTFVGVWIRKLISGEPFEVWGGNQLRDFTYVDDAVNAFLLAGSHDEAVGGVFNVGGTPPVSLREMAELMVEVNGSGEFVVRDFPEDRRKIDIGDFYADYTLIHEVLGWEHHTSLASAVRQTLDYYRHELPYYL